MFQKIKIESGFCQIGSFNGKITKKHTCYNVRLFDTCLFFFGIFFILSKN